MNPSGAPSWPIIEYQPRLFGGADMASSEGSPSQEPPSARPWPMRRITSAQTAFMPAVSKLGKKVMPTVHTPSNSSARVSLVARPQRRCTAMESAVPTGRATKASEKMANAASVPSSLDR